jgi:predicted ribosomally synthesized peptide with nif11-like leader
MTALDAMKERYHADADFRAAVAAAADAGDELRIVRDFGFDITAADLAAKAAQPLNAEELEAVGGGCTSVTWSTVCSC